MYVPQKQHCTALNPAHSVNSRFHSDVYNTLDMSTQTLSALVAVAKNGTIGLANQLPWKLRSDLQRFKRLTMGNTLIMGRKTFESIGKPLPGRQTIVLSRQQGRRIEGVQLAASLDEALKMMNAGCIGFVVGGAEIYRLAMPRIQSLYLTKVLANIAGDAFFCSWNEDAFECVERSFQPADDYNDWPTEFLHLRRKSTGDFGNNLESV